MMMLNIIFWIFIIGIGLASFQDLKRREVDHWLVLLLMVFGFAYMAFEAIFSENSSMIILGIVSFLIMFILMNLFYYGRVFAGGDAKLLFAMFIVFVGATLVETLANIGVFILFLMIAGGIYGLVYSLVLFGMNFRAIKKEFKEGFKNVYFRYAFFAGIILFVFSYVDWIFLGPAVLLFISPVLFVFAKAVENVVMVKAIPAKDLREGDWLEEDIKIGRKVIKADWDGLDLEDIALLKKRGKKVTIKNGIPFVPAFFFGFLAWWFFKGWVFGLIGM
jgi:Flp pilus assembly protein protease CpaA